jgi:hypothetical protein
MSRPKSRRRRARHDSKQAAPLRRGELVPAAEQGVSDAAGGGEDRGKDTAPWVELRTPLLLLAAVIVSGAVVMATYGPPAEGPSGSSSSDSSSASGAVIPSEDAAVGAGDVAETAPPSSNPDSGVRGSSHVRLTFDELVTGDAVTGWETTANLAIRVSPTPTAVDRSAFLRADEPAIACLRQEQALGAAQLIFMVDELPEAPFTVVAFGVDDAGLSLEPDGSLQTTRGTTVGTLAAGAWYTLALEFDGSSGVVTLAASGDELLGRESIDLIETASSLCVGTAPSTAVYIDEVEVVADG